MVDTEGRLVGVNAAGRGSLLTIPAETVVSIAKKMSESGSIKQAYLGVRSQTAEISTTSELSRDQETGLLIVGVEDDSPATQSGIITGDIVVAFNSEPIRTPGALLDSLANSQEGDTAKIEIIRGGKVISVEVELGGRDVRSQRHHRGRRGHRHRR